MSKEIIKSLGLSDNESEVYLLLLNQKEALAADIAKKSKISRPHIYDTIAKLIDKGLASYVIKNGKKYFKPADPEVFMDLLKSKEDSLKNILPDLKTLYSPQKEKPVVEVYEGKEGLKVVLNQLIKLGEDFSALGPTINWQKEVPIALERYLRKREKIGFKGRLLSPEGTDVLKVPLNTYKSLPKEYASPATTVMYGDKTCLILWLDTIVTILIENKELAESFKNYFNLMWNQKTITYHGDTAIKMMMEDIIKSKPKEYLTIGSSGRTADQLGQEWVEWNNKRIKLNINNRRIFNDSEAARKIAKPYLGELRDAKFIPMQGGDSPFNSVVYNDKVWIFRWGEHDTFGIMIEDKNIAKGFRSEFDTLWNQKERIYRGVEGVKRVLMMILEEKPKEMCVYGTSGASVLIFPEFINEWHRKRREYKIHTRMIYVDTKVARDRVHIFKDDPYYDVRFMPGDYISPVATFVLDDKVVLMSITDNGFATIIEHEDIVEIYKKQFESFWKMSRKAF
ncbi:TrmB family transcriptional regulator [Candidatus Woesearchaeota archaeon]|nr:TrmB family transcriptional regulator [Candidatus Woesearchaeota archaeon]